MFGGKIWSLPQSGAPEWGFLCVSSSNTKFCSRLKRPGWNKHSSLFGPFVSYETIKAMWIRPKLHRRKLY